ncbi:hypothetical protein MC885_001842 [Smutsia gigantea]|nr:hypothetical protein MC885_001842 [Smutsia gigantea]
MPPPSALHLYYSALGSQAAGGQDFRMQPASLLKALPCRDRGDPSQRLLGAAGLHPSALTSEFRCQLNIPIASRHFL